MLTPNEYDHLTDQLMHLYWDLDDAILADITRRLMKTGGEYLPFSASEQAKRMQQAGLLYEDIIAEVAKRSGMTTRQVANIFERAGVQSVRNDNRCYQAAGLEGIVKLSDAALQTLHAGYRKCAGELQNLTLTTANTAQTAYLQACDLAYMEVSTGTLDYGTAIRNAIRTAAEQGSYVLYPSGHRDRLDVAVRRSVLTGVGQTVRTLLEINAGDMGCDLMEISAHAGARPSHAQWQGQIVSLSGRRGYLSKRDIGYGTGDGFGGWNCRHDWYPFFEGISRRTYTQEELERLNEPHIDLGDDKLYTDYEVSQMQRALERDVRKCKRSTVAFQTALDEAKDDRTRQAMQAEYTASAVRLKASEKKLRDFCKQTGSLEDRSRVWVNGFGRSEAQRAVWADRRDLTSAAYHDIIALKGTLSDRDARMWYLAHDKTIPDLIDRSKTLEEQARQACELRNQFRTQARELMKDQEKRRQLDVTDPNRSFEELIADKMRRKNLTHEEAIEDILKTATKTRKSVNKMLGLE